MTQNVIYLTTIVFSVLPPVWRGTLAPLLLAVLPRLERDVGQHLLVHEAPEPDGEVPGDPLDGRGQVLAQSEGQVSIRLFIRFRR